MMCIESQDGWRRRRRKEVSLSAAAAEPPTPITSLNNTARETDRMGSTIQNSTMSSSHSRERRSMISSRTACCRPAFLLLNCCIVLSALASSTHAFHLPPSYSSSTLSRRIYDSLDQNHLNSITTQSSLASVKSQIPQRYSHSSQLYSSTSEQTSTKRTAKMKQQQSLSKSSPNKKKYKKKRKYARKLPLSPSEKAAAINRKKRRAAYEKMRTTSLEITNEPPSIWSFDSLFPDPVLDEKSIREDLFGSKDREKEMRERQLEMNKLREKKKMEVEKQEKEYLIEPAEDEAVMGQKANTREEDVELTRQTIMKHVEETTATTSSASKQEGDKSEDQSQPQSVDKTLTRMVEDRIYGMTRSPTGSMQYSTSLLDTSRAVQFREGVRLGKALTINMDRLCHFAKKDMSHGRLEEAQEYYLEALKMEPSDGRPYLGLSRIAQRRGDLDQARSLLKKGIQRSSGGFIHVKGPGKVAVVEGKKKRSKRKGSDVNKSPIDFEEEEGSTIATIPDLGPNPFLLQALGTLEQKLGNLAAAEELYLQAIRSRPSHAAAWVSLAQLRTKELRQGASAGRSCYQSAERELNRIGAKPNAFVYTAWASMEYKKGREDAKSLRRARELYQKALAADPNCSVAYLQLGVMESECGNFDKAKECFETVLTFDQRNSRVLQAYAIMESRRPREDVNSRRVIDLFERALKANPRDAGVYQAYALYVADLGDVDSARDLLRRGTEVNKRHAPVWQAWGVLETRYSTAKIARDVFQQGIWSCAQYGGGQSGGRRCARLWQAWGVLEAQEGDHAAARRCFSRALDADQRNVAAVTAWTLMEAELGNFADARSIFERSLKMFRSPSADKTSIWRAYEIMEERAGNTRKAQLVFQRSMSESMASSGDEDMSNVETSSDFLSDTNTVSRAKSSKRVKEVEVSRWDTGSNELDAEVWINNGSIEGKLPASAMKKLNMSRQN